jgi:hypothetical protein
MKDWINLETNLVYRDSLDLKYPSIFYNSERNQIKLQKYLNRKENPL